MNEMFIIFILKIAGLSVRTSHLFR